MYHFSLFVVKIFIPGLELSSIFFKLFLLHNTWPVIRILKQSTKFLFYLKKIFFREGKSSLKFFFWLRSNWVVRSIYLKRKYNLREFRTHLFCSFFYAFMSQKSLINKKIVLILLWQKSTVTFLTFY